MRRTRSVLFGLTFACAAVPACRKADLGFNVYVPGSVVGNTSWVEVGVFPNRCPDGATLAGGIPDGVVSRVAFRPKNASAPPVGQLKKGPYGFAAVARAEDCSVLAAGCSVVDLSSAKDIAINLQALDNPVGACGAGESCNDARCVPALDTSHPAT